MRGERERKEHLEGSHSVLLYLRITAFKCLETFCKEEEFTLILEKQEKAESGPISGIMEGNTEIQFHKDL